MRCMRAPPVYRVALVGAPDDMKAIVTSTKMMTEYAAMGDLHKSIQVFEEMPRKNQVTWNAMLSLLIKFEQLDSARQLYEQMPERNQVSHTLIITAFSRQGLVEKARGTFDGLPLCDRNVFPWTAMISCYAHNCQPVDALKFFRSTYGGYFTMRVLPNSHTFSILIKACVDAGSLSIGRQIQALMRKVLDEDAKAGLFVQNSLIDLYAKFGNLPDAENIFSRMKWKDLSSFNVMMSGYTNHFLIDEATRIFYSMKERDAVSWNVVISGTAEIGRLDRALNLFVELMGLCPETKPSPSTYCIGLSLCATISALQLGRQIHTQTLKLGLEQSNTFVGNSLVTMYDRCGRIELSELVFKEMRKKDVVTWNSLVQGLGQNGYAEKALDYAEKALKSEICNSTTFVAILTSCSHGGLVEAGCKYLSWMRTKYGVEPSLDHYICVVDMLARAGKITEAYVLTCKMPFKPNSVVWSTILHACLVHGNRKMGEIAAQELKTLEPSNVVSDSVLAHVQSKAGRFDESTKIMNLRRDRVWMTQTGYSWTLRL